MSLLPTTNEWASHQVYVKAKKMVQKQDEELATLRQQLAEAQCLLQQAKEGLQSAVSFQTTMEKLLLQFGYTAKSLELDKLSKAQKALMAIDQSMKEE